MAVTGRWEASLFFILFFFVIVLFLTNLVTAFVLDAYFAEQDIKEEEEEARDEVEIPLYLQFQFGWALKANQPTLIFPRVRSNVFW